MTKTAPALYWPTPCRNSCGAPATSSYDQQLLAVDVRTSGQDVSACRGRHDHALAKKVSAQVKVWSGRPQVPTLRSWAAAALLQGPLLRLCLDVGIVAILRYVAIEASTKVTVHLCSADGRQPERQHRRRLTHSSSAKLTLFNLGKTCPCSVRAPKHAFQPSMVLRG